MASLKIKLKCNSTLATRDSVLKITNNFHIKCSRINKVNPDLLLMYCNSSKDVDLLFSDKCLSELKKVKCTPIVPPGLQATRTIIVRRLDAVIYDEDVDTIKCELERVNTWLVISSIFKFPNSRTIKITCKNQDMVSRALSQGSSCLDFPYLFIIFPKKNLSIC